MSISLNFPTDLPTLNLDFVNNPYLDPRITFTRNSTATYFNSAGVLTTAANNVARFDYDPVTLKPKGLLIEEDKTNFFLNTGVVYGGTVGTGNVNGPDNANCRTFIPNSGPVSYPSVGTSSQSFTLANTANVDYSFSGYFATGPIGSITLEPRIIIDFSLGSDIANTILYAELQINTSSWTVRSKSLPSPITEKTAPSITLVKTGLYRITWTVTYTQNVTNRDTVRSYIQVRLTTNSGIYTADGISGIQYAFCQIERGSPTSTIPTTNAAVTRNAETAIIDGSNFTSWFNNTEGTIYVESVSAMANSTFPRYVTISDNSINNSIRISGSGDTLFGGGRVDAGGTAQATLLLSPVLPNIKYKHALAYKINDFAYIANSTTSITHDSSGTVPTVNRINIGSDQYGAQINGYVLKVLYYPSRLSNTQLIALTRT